MKEYIKNIIIVISTLLMSLMLIFAYNTYNNVLVSKYNTGYLTGSNDTMIQLYSYLASCKNITVPISPSINMTVIAYECIKR